MAEKPPKRKAKPEREPPSVLGTLPATRSQRIGRPRDESAKPAPKRKRETPPATAAAAKKRAPRKREAPAATTATVPARKRRAVATAPAHANGTAGAPHGPTAVRPGSPPLRVQRATDAPPPKPIGAPTGTELVTTTIRAAGELAQIGFTVGGQVLKRAIDRFPRP